ncbi:nucleotidyl transferase AbiEii/AbiGii toxin family protein [Cellulomonas hominis]|uniref:nucleotidyl transferase AbiEii/AbiGii toxin family protein n=1 Tax=Cellulomonas hominis TaxID=156981 RepID=UPI001B948D88|nr:nucleotidyl transferase AbiEii/AbiGii toxin family protein [Cellulomonas hominis]VTR76045.1 hypothetical protein CHMI_00801 [Cellulomonas hominis]
MLPFHERLARIGLEATEQYGFVLAGGYAVAANGMGDRLSEDVDLFTNRQSPDDFAKAVDALKEAYDRHGLQVDVVRDGPTFLDVVVSDARTGDSSSIQLGLDYREHAPARLEIGPVLDVQDAVANKVTALYSRGETRDYIDVDLVVQSGRFTRAKVLELGDAREVEPMDRAMLAARFQQAATHTERQFARYGVDPVQRTQVVDRFAQWGRELDGAPADPAQESAAARAVREAHTSFPGLHNPSAPARAARPPVERGAPDLGTGLGL